MGAERGVRLLVIGLILFASACGDDAPAGGDALPPVDASAPLTVGAPQPTAPPTAPAPGDPPASSLPPASTAAQTPSEPSEVRADSASFVVTAPSRSFGGRVPVEAEPDPLASENAETRPAFVIDEARWLVGDCCRVAVVLQDERPLYPDDQLRGRFESESLSWEIYDIGPQDGSLIVAVATLGDLSIAVSGQTLFKDVPSEQSTVEVVESLARSKGSSGE